MANKHFDDTGHDISNYGMESANPQMAYMSGQPQYVIYQPFPMGANPGGVSYPHQYTPQVMVPIPIQVSRDQVRPVTDHASDDRSYGRELSTSNRKPEDLDYFLNRSDKKKERRYRSRSRSGSKSLGEISDSPVRTHRSRSVSKSVDKGSSSSHRTEKLEPKLHDKRPENPFRKRKSKSPSPKKLPENPFRKTRGRSRSRERATDKSFKKRRSVSRDNIKINILNKPKRQQLSPLKITSLRRSRSPDKRRSPDSLKRKRRRSSSQRKRSSSRGVDKRERHKKSSRGRSRSPHQDDSLRDRSFKYSKDRAYKHEQFEKRQWSPEFSPERSHFVPDGRGYRKGREEFHEEFADEFPEEFSERKHYEEHDFDYEWKNERRDYNHPRQRSRQSYSPISDERSDRSGIGLKIHLSNQGRWIEDKAKPALSPPRKTRLMEDGVMVESHGNELMKSVKRESVRRPAQTRYIEDDVEVFYDEPQPATSRRRSWDDTFEFEDVIEDVSDSDSFDSQKDHKTLRSVGSRYIKDNHSSFSGNAGFDNPNTDSMVSERLNVQNLCIDYNNDHQTCANQCRYLHLCKFFVLGICKYADSCKKNHDVLSPEIFFKLRKQNPRLQSSKFVADKVKEILFSRFNRNKQIRGLHMPEIPLDRVSRSPSVESIKSEGSVGSIDSFDARYYTADYSAETKKPKIKSEIQEKTIDKSKTENTVSDEISKSDEQSKSEECVVIVNIDDNNETLKEEKEMELGSDISKVSVELEIPDEVTNDKSDTGPKLSSSKPKQVEKVKSQTNNLKDLKKDEKSKSKNDNKTVNQSKSKSGSKEKHDNKEKPVKKDKTVAKDNTVVKKESVASEKTVNKEKVEDKKKGTSKSDSHKKVEGETKDALKKQEDDSKLEKGVKSRSLSPVSVENIEDWDKLDRYDRVSEDGMSDGENVQIAVDEDLESISSNESSDEREKELEFGPGMINKVAVPIGMNDPLVFSSSLKGGDADAEPQTSVETPQTVSHVAEPIISNIQPTIFPPPVNFNVPPPMLPTRFPLLHPQQAPTHVGPLFPTGMTQSQINISQPPPINVPAQPFHPSFPNQRHPIPNLGPMVPSMMPAMVPHPIQMVPNMQHPINPPVNHLPSPDMLKEVIGTLTQKQEIKIKEIEAKKTAEATKESKDKKVVRVDTDLKEPMKKLWQFPHKGVINMSIIEFVTETEAYKDEMVAEMVKLLVTINLPYVTLKKLKSVIKENIQINIRTPIDLRKILELYPDNFQIIETVDSDDDSDDGEVKKNVQIKPRLKLGFCSKHGYLPFYVGKCDCQQLHLCKFYFLSHCPNKNCKFGHKLKTDHNINTLKHHRLHRMTGEEIMEFLRDIDSRNIETVPGVCKFYNSNMSKASGCYKGDVTDYQDICHNLHLCFYYVKGKCFMTDCKRSHSIRDTQPNSLLKKYGLDPEEFGETKILDLIAQKTVDAKKKKEEKAEQFQNTRQMTPEGSRKASLFQSNKSEVSKTVSEGQSGINKSLIKGNQKKKASVKFPSVCKFFNNPSGCKKKDWGVSGFCLFLHVCQKYVNGLCRIGDKCKRPHTFFSGEPATLIGRYGIDLTRLTEQEILDTLTQNKNALTELPMIGDDEDVEEEKVKEIADVKKSVPSNTQASANIQNVHVGGGAMTQHFSSHNIDEVLQHIMSKGGNTK